MYELVKIAGCDDAERAGDVVFVHGASADSDMAWYPPGRPAMSFPKLLAEDLPSIGTWSLNYQMSFMRWQPRSMPLSEQGLNTLSEMASKGFGRRPIIFIAHSVGGLVVKHLLRHAGRSSEPECASKNPEWGPILRQTKGIVFLSTPHFGVRIPWLAKAFTRQNVMRNVAAGNEDLRRLNDDFQDIVRVHGIGVQVYYEQRPTPRRPQIDARTADPNLRGVEAIPVNSDHDGICQPTSKGGLPYSGICAFVRTCCAPQEASESNADFDVFLGHNSRDKPFVEQLARALRQRGLKVWDDKSELVPGRPWLDGLETIIRTVKSAAILIGSDGLGPWEGPEMRACLRQFVKRSLPVIPVLLPGATALPEHSIFIDDFHLVDLRDGLTDDGLDQLEWGITGVKP